MTNKGTSNGNSDSNSNSNSLDTGILHCVQDDDVEEQDAGCGWKCGVRAWRERGEDVEWKCRMRM
jgi:hypothetical protein